ncbi:unnamed protein product [Staurois parvus]|uniref:Uncharacterized protein n=1 Tax=Staurois parvus TaxID=386267 RepID=A0ABN9AQD6_9NEOB|nr:unnamed protein product [Staurois parvus]
MCRVTPHYMSDQEIRGGHWKKGRIREVRIKQPQCRACFLHIQTDFTVI